MLNDGTGFKKVYLACGFTDLRRGIDGLACIFRKNRALAPHERSAVPLGTDHCPVG